LPEKINNDYIEKYITNIVNSNESYNIFINANMNNTDNTADMKNLSTEAFQQSNNASSQSNLNNP
jgi:hypothetical protein